MKVPKFAEVEHTDEDIARFSAMSPEERVALFLELCDLTDAVQASRPNLAALRTAQPRSDEALALWKRLMIGAAHDR